MQNPSTEVMRLCQRCLLTVIVVFAFGVVCHADVVLLTNGDRVSGEIEKLDKEKLSLKTEFAGTIQIDWKKVAQLESDKEYDVEASSGQKIRGKLAFATTGLMVNAGDARVPLSLVSVKAVTPAVESEGLLGSLHGNVNVGYSFAGGNNNVSNSTVSANARYHTETYQIGADVQSLFNRQTNQTPTSRQFGSLRYDRYLSPQSFWFTGGSLEHDESKKLELRTNLGGGLGWKVLSQDKHEANLLGGLTYVNEQYQDPTTVPTGSSSEALMGLDMRNAILGGIEATNKISLSPNLVQLGRYRMAMESGVRMPLLSRYVWSFQVFDRFDSRPPVEAKRNDYGAISSFGVTF